MRLREDALDGRVGALAGRAAGAVGHRDEIRLQRREPRDRFPERLLHLRGLRRKKFERDVQCGARRRRRRSGWRAAHSSRHLARGRLRQHDARIAGEPQRHRDLAFRSGRQGLLPHHVEARGFEPLRHRLGGKAEPAMGVLFAQEFEIVRREVDDQQPAARPQHARRLADGAALSSRKCST